MKQDVITTYQEQLLAWYAIEKRSLPWRDVMEPYYVFVSEVMLQQTQVERVLPKFHEFITAYPTIYDLVAAENGELLRIWQGMGYNSRVLRMREFARSVVQEYGGVIPKDRAVLQKLPGIGPYTSGAILCFGYGQDVAFIDTNIKRILHRVFVGLEFGGWIKTDKEMDVLSEEVYPRGRAFDYHQALMDLGSSLCKAAKVQCTLCPLQECCQAAKEIKETPEMLLERKTYKKKTIPFKESKRFIRGGVVDMLRGEQLLSFEDIQLSVEKELRPMKTGELEGILDDLVREGILQYQEGKYSL